jgi:hypothetical protein
MPCKWIRLPDGTVAHVKFANSPAKKCRWCGLPCTKLCDFEVSSPQQVTHRRTCDAPMCDAHAKHISHEIDYCPAHAAKSETSEAECQPKLF